MALFTVKEKEKSDDWKWSFSDYPKEKNGLKVFSCFSCGGGSTMGYKLAGCDVIGNVEIDEKMNELYKLNHNPKYNYCMDIRDFNSIPNEELPEELFNLDILDGSPPCTTFSMAGDREKTWGKKKKFREGQKEQTLDDLLFVFIDTVAKLKPKTVIMENVEGLARGAAVDYLNKVYDKFKSIGYQVRCYLLKGEEMGVPQKRHRVFFIATKDLSFNYNNLDMNFNYEPIPYKDIKTGEHKQVNPDTKTYTVLCEAKDDEIYLDKAYARLYGKPSWFQPYIIRDNIVLYTMRAKQPDVFFKCDNNFYFINSDEVRNSQTFPQDYNFNNNEVGYVCGMSVPPIMTKRIVERMRKAKMI